MPTTAATSRKSNSWRTSASRRSRQPTSSAGINSDNGTYKLNPYKNKLNHSFNSGKSKLRGSGGGSNNSSNNPQVVRGVIIDDDELDGNNDSNGIVDSKKEDINILNDILNSDDDELGLDNILSSISDNKSISNTTDDVNILSSSTANNVTQQQDNNIEADSTNNIIPSNTDDTKIPSSVPTSNNINDNIRLPSNNSRHDINRLSDTTPPIQNASSNISSSATKIQGSSSPPQQHQKQQQQQIVSNISSRALDFDIENDILPTASHNIAQESSVLFPTPIRNNNDNVKSNSELLGGSDKRVPSSENIIPPEGALEKRLSESTPPLQHSELDGETVTINPTTTISGVTGETTTVSGLSTNSGNTSISRSSMQQDDNTTEISPVSEESQTITISEEGSSNTKDIDNDTLWTDGDATRQHKLQMSSKDHVNPTFTSGGFIGSTTNTSNLNQMNMTNQKIGLRDPSLVGSSLVDSLIDDISLPGGGMGISGISLPDDGRGGCGSIVQQNIPPPQSSPDATPLRGGQQHRFNQHEIEQEQQQQVDNFHQELNPLPPQSTGHDRRSYDNYSNELPISKLKIHNTTLHEDETLSTVTDPTESPFIYTYQRRRTAGDDGTSDSVSQITSSIAGSNYSSYQNIPNSFPRQSNRNANNLSWMNTSNAIGTTSSAGSSSRMIHRKNKSRSGVNKKKSSNKGISIPGPYGSSSNNRDVMIRSGSGSGGSGGNNSTGSGTRSTSSYNDIIDNNGGVNDEIDYAMNNTNKSTSRRPSAKKRQQQQQSQHHHHRQMSSNMSMTDDLSTVESTGNYIDTESTFDVSRLGMGGVSTMHQPSLRSSSGQSVISEGTNESTTQGLGILHYLRLAQHHITRYFFPKPPRIERRKKFDRTDSDDLEELLLEEGQSSIKRSGSSTIDNDEESTMDYYGSPGGSSPTGSPRGNKRSRRDDKNKGSTTRTIGLFILISAIIAVYRMPTNNSRETRDGRYQDEIEFRVANSDRDPYDNFDNVGRNIQDHNNGQVLDYTDNNNGNYGDQYDNNNAMISAEIDAADTFDTMDKQYLNIQLPAKFDVLANVDDMLFQKGIDIPFYWHVPRSGGGTMNDLLGSCLHLTLAADAGGGNQDDTLKVLKFGPTMSFVNVDTSTHSGIVRAKSLNLASSGLADAVISPLLHEATTLFTPTRRGRMFTIFRHPVERAASLFYFIQETQWRAPETRNEQFADITIQKFYKNGFAENNWMTRFLTNELTKGELTENDLNIAKEVLRKKCLIGLLEEKHETFERIQKYFGWRPRDEEDQNCLEKKLEWTWPMKHKHTKVEHDTRAWRLIAAANKYDMQLYDYAKELFGLQGREIFDREGY